MAAVARMQPEDTTYWLVREAFGWSVVLQILWRFPAVPQHADLETFAERLRHSVLNRRLIRARTPFARHRWVHADFAPELLVDEDPILVDEVEAWSGTELYSSPLDPERGPAWRLRGVPIEGGGFVLSLTALHLIADGRTMVTAAAAALTGAPTDPLAHGPAHGPLSRVAPGPRPSSSDSKPPRRRSGPMITRSWWRVPLGRYLSGSLVIDGPTPSDDDSGYRRAVRRLSDSSPGLLAARGVTRRLGDIALDAADGVGQVGAAGLGIGRAAVAFTRHRGAEAPGGERPTKPQAHVRSPLARNSWATVSVDAAHWESVAGQHGGTTNTLFIAILAGALRASGYGTALKVGVPVSRRAQDDDARGNATAGVSVLLTEDLTPGGDLGPLRRQCKEAFTRLSAGERAPHVHLLPLVSLLPTGLVVRAATAGSGMPDVVASNLGDFADEVRCLGGISASAVAFRGIAQGVDPAEPYRFGDGVQSWAMRTGDVWTFSVAAFDEQHFPRPDDLRELLAVELDGWGVEHRMW
ncbi:hypothetical protein [Nocardia mangyaensis]|uniref:hypothetical protein n=1 Tax=Nocardia mangyaensis TaxID=2213200 RepID=UPI002674858A|nr:hypothetical protein [Nocardia mangyaensis]MDO3648379.1 hypothetical protein [Nocardia mangyaensis]